MESYYLVINLGFRSIRGIVFDSKGSILYKSARSVLTLQVGQFVEQDVLEIQLRLDSILEELSSLTEIISKVRYVTFTASSTCVVPTDNSGKPLSPLILVADRRAIDEAASLESLERLRNVRGKSEIDCTHMLSKILWLKKNLNLPENVEFHSTNDFFAKYFTGKFVTDSLNAQKMLYCSDEQKYSDQALKLIGIDQKNLPQVVYPGTNIGLLKKRFHNIFNMPETTQFIVTTYDAICGLIGSFPEEVGEACDVSGTVTSLRVFGGISNESNRVSEKLFYQSCPFWNTSILGGSNNLGGGLIEWLKDLYYQSEPDPYSIINEEVSRTPAGSRGLVFLPYLMGERAPIWDDSARGVFFGIDRSHRRADFATSVLESAGFSLLGLINEVESSGQSVNSIVSSGGLSQLHIINQIKADITGKTIKVSDEIETTALGAFVLMAISSGVFGTIFEASKKLRKIKETYHPKSENRKLYRDFYELYKTVYASLSPAFLLRAKLANSYLSQSEKRKVSL